MLNEGQVDDWALSYMVDFRGACLFVKPNSIVKIGANSYEALKPGFFF